MGRKQDGVCGAKDVRNPSLSGPGDSGHDQRVPTAAVRKFSRYYTAPNMIQQNTLSREVRSHVQLAEERPRQGSTLGPHSGAWGARSPIKRRSVYFSLFCKRVWARVALDWESSIDPGWSHFAVTKILRVWILDRHEGCTISRHA